MARWEFGEHFRHLASPKAGCSVRDPVGMVSAKEVSDEGNTVQRRTSKELLLKVRQPLSCCPTWHLNACRCPPRSLYAESHRSVLFASKEFHDDGCAASRLVV